MRFEIPLLLAFAASSMAKGPWFFEYHKQRDCAGDPGIIGDNENMGHDKCYPIDASSSIKFDPDFTDTVADYYTDDNCKRHKGTIRIIDKPPCHNAEVRSFKVRQGGPHLE